MGKKMREEEKLSLRLDPEQRLCPMFDSVSVKRFAAPDRGEMGLRVLDDCAEEHIM